jgi:hypothetical protein
MSARSIKILFISWTALAGFISFMGLLVGDTWQVLAGFWGLLWGITVLDLRDTNQELKEARKQMDIVVEELQKVRKILDLEKVSR